MPIVAITTYSDRMFRRRFVYKAGDPAVPVDLTGTTLLMKLRRQDDDTEAVLVLTTEDGSLPIEAGSGGGFEVYISKARLRRLAPGVYVHSLLWLRPGSDPEGVWDGTLTHKPGPSR